MALVLHRNFAHVGPTPSFRGTYYGNYDSLLGPSSEHNLSMMEKRQLFLRSYQFRRKKSLAERIKRSLVRLKKLIWIKFRSARKIRRLVWSSLRYAFYSRRRRRFRRLLNHKNNTHNRNSSVSSSSSSSSSSCFW